MKKEEELNKKVIIYNTEDGKTEIEVSLEDETVWLSQSQMAELFQKDIRTISEHIQNVYLEKELEKNPTIRNFRIVQKEGRVKKGEDCKERTEKISRAEKAEIKVLPRFYL